MNTREIIFKQLEELGLRPKYDDDGDLCVRYEMKNMYFVTEVGDEKFVSVVLPQIREVNEGDEALALTACNKINREVKLIKIYLDQNLQNISASCEFYFTDDESLKSSVRHSLIVLGRARTALNEAISDLT